MLLFWVISPQPPSFCLGETPRIAKCNFSGQVCFYHDPPTNLMDFAVISLITIGPPPSCLPQRFPSNLHLSLINKVFVAHLQMYSQPFASPFLCA